MQTEILQKPDYALVKVTFDRPGEQLMAESGAMVARASTVEMKTNLRGGLLASAKRKLLGGESLFMNTFTAKAPGDHVLLAAAVEGDAVKFDVRPDAGLMVHSGAFLAAASTVTLDTKWGGAKGFFGAGLFLLRASGTGPLLVSAYGGIHAVDVGHEGFICDNDHVVAFTEGLEYEIRKVGGMKGLLFSGEGLVCYFRGRGRVWMQTRNPRSLAAWVHPFRRVQKSNN